VSAWILRCVVVDLHEKLSGAETSYRLNSNGAATAPWGTPAQIGNISDIADPERTEKCLFLK